MSEGDLFTLQQFTAINAKPWFALQQQNDAGVVRQWTGYRDEMDDLIEVLGVVPEEREPVTEEQFFAQIAECGGYDE